VLLVTAGEKGADLFTPAFSKHYDVPKITPLSTIGAGDTFSAGIIYGLYDAEAPEKKLSEMTEDQWDKALECAINFATQVCMSYDNYVPDSQNRV
jgi:fructokinase